MKNPSFARSIAIITAFAIATRGLGFVFRIILARILGAELLGIYQIAFSLFMVFLTIIASGLPLIISRQIAQNSPNPREAGAKPIVTSGLLISFTASILIVLAIFLLKNQMNFFLADRRSIYLLAILAPALFFYSVYTVLRSVWWGRKQFFLLGLTELIEQVARIIILAILLTVGFLFTDLSWIAAISFTLACVISASVVVFIYAKEARQSKSDIENITIHNTQPDSPHSYSSSKLLQPTVPILKSAAPITAVRCIMTLALPIIAIIVPMRLIAAGWSSSDAIAHFGIIVGMTLPLLSVPQAVISSMATALVPELSSASKIGDTHTISKQIKSCIKFTLFINFLLFPIFVSVGTSIGTFLFAEPLAGTYLRQSAWIMIPLSLSLITNAVLNSLGHETRAMAHYLIGSIALFTSIWFLPQFIGVGALVVGLGATTSIAAILNIIKIQRKTGTDAQLVRLLFGYLIISIPAIVIGQFTYAIFDFLPIFINLVIAGTVTLGVFLTLAYMFNLLEFESLTKRFKNKKKQLSNT